MRVLITGGSSGIGLACARAIAADDAAAEVGTLRPRPAAITRLRNVRGRARDRAHGSK